MVIHPHWVSKGKRCQFVEATVSVNEPAFVKEGKRIRTQFCCSHLALPETDVPQLTAPGLSCAQFLCKFLLCDFIHNVVVNDSIRTCRCIQCSSVPLILDFQSGFYQFLVKIEMQVNRDVTYSHILFKSFQKYIRICQTIHTYKHTK